MFDWLKKAFGDSEPERKRQRAPEPEFRPAKLPPRRSQAGQNAPPQKPVTAIWVVLKIADEQALFIMLDADGSINRSGAGSVDNTDRDLFIGRTSPDFFKALRQRIGPDLLQWIGQYADPSPEGKKCDLTVGFVYDDKSEAQSHWRYGAESLGPPPVVRDFVTAAANATRPWFEKQKNMVKK